MSKSIYDRIKSGEIKVHQRSPIEYRFWSRVEKTDSCWNWFGKTNNLGYGQLKFAGEWLLTHRFAYELLKRSIGNLWVLHTCDNPACVNPKHLFLGTRQDNSNDMVSKGRQARWEKNGRAILTVKIVSEIRERYLYGDKVNGQKALAKEFGVCVDTISKIITNRNWRNLGGGKS